MPPRPSPAVRKLRRLGVQSSGLSDAATIASGVGMSGRNVGRGVPLVNTVFGSLEHFPSYSSAMTEPSPSGLSAAPFSQSLERGLLILSALAGRRAVLGIADIAREVNLSKSTTYRYAATLTQLDY